VVGWVGRVGGGGGGCVVATKNVCGLNNVKINIFLQFPLSDSFVLRGLIPLLYTFSAVSRIKLVREPAGSLTTLLFKVPQKTAVFGTLGICYFF
jgi:hypothetical protein